MALGKILYPAVQSPAPKGPDPEIHSPPLAHTLNLHQFAASSFHKSGKGKKVKLAPVLIRCVLKFLLYI